MLLKMYNVKYLMNAFPKKMTIDITMDKLTIEVLTYLCKEIGLYSLISSPSFLKISTLVILVLL